MTSVRFRAIPRGAEVGLLTPEPDVEAAFLSFGALGLAASLAGLVKLVNRPPKSALRRREAGALRDAADEVRSAERRRREVRLRLLPRLAVREAHFAERQDSCGLYAFVNVHAALAFGNKLRAVVCAERRRAVVAERGGQVQLVVQVERRLPEVRLVVNLRLIIARRIACERVDEC